MSICKTCGQEKEDVEFGGRVTNGKFYKKRDCLICCAARRKAYNDRTKDKRAIWEEGYRETKKIKRKEYNDRTKEERAIWGKEYYEKNKDKIRDRAQKRGTAINEWSRNRRSDPEKREEINRKKREWYYKNRDKCTAASKQYKQENREKINAHARLEAAVKTGRIAKPERCQGCGEKLPLEGHHQEHSAWDKVIWLCKMCHAGVHMKIRDKKREQEES